MNPCLNSADPEPPPYTPPPVPTVGRHPAASPRLPPALPPPSYQVCVGVPSPGLRPSPPPPPPPPPSALPEDGAPDLECWVCYSHFNNVFRCPKMLECRHTFCLECLARINVKSAQPAAIRCPLCRRMTPLPALGLPRLATDGDVLASLPPAMRRVWSVRFQRSKGKLQVKRLSQGQRRCAVKSLDVGLPSPPSRNGGGNGGVGGALLRLTGRPACRALLLALLFTTTVALTGIVVFLLTYDHDGF